MTRLPQRRRRGLVRRRVTIAVLCYAISIAALWLVVEVLTDRVWPATLISFGPRWLAALPLLPLLVIAGSATSGRRAWILYAVLALTGVVVLLGVMDFRLALQRGSGPPVMRLMTQNLGESEVTADALLRLLTTESIDVAALQECPFYDYAARPGWHFYYGGNLCLISRFPFTVLDVADAANAWKQDGGQALRFEIAGPTGRFHLLNVHLRTIRGGIESLRAGGWSAIPQFAANRADTMRQSADARRRVQIGTVPLVVTGDFNLPVESAVYRTFWSDLANAFSRCGRGFGYTKLTGWFGIRIDHVLMSHHWTCAGARVLDSPFGGDHRPLVVDVRPS
jgi:endonuclease/exonuclease/phosphatase (EEP) superfamily protein YafD